MFYISGYGELPNKRFKIKLYKKIALSDCYLSLKSHVKGELFPLRMKQHPWVVGDHAMCKSGSVP